MKVQVLKESGYDEAVLGFSLSYNTNIDRVKEILPKYAFGVPGEGKFLESIVLWLDVTAPRFWWQEADTYRVGTTKQSESTMHTIKKRMLTNEDFEYPLSDGLLNILENSRLCLNGQNPVADKISIDVFKNVLPEGFLQRRIWMMSYKTLQGMYYQRIKHRLPQWQYFLNTVVSQIEHPEFIIKKELSI